MDRLASIALFVAVAETDSFVAAARKTGRSPAGVSRAIAALEEVLGQRLFNRTTRALSLTEAGEQLLARGRRLLAEYDDMADALQGGGDFPRGVLTLTAPVMFGRLHIMPIPPATAQRLEQRHGVGIACRLCLHQGDPCLRTRLLGCP